MQNYSYVKYTGKEEVFVEAVRQCGDFSTVAKPVAKVSILFRLTVTIFIFLHLFMYIVSFVSSYSLFVAAESFGWRQIC